jgi:hypothetical protein
MGRGVADRPLAKKEAWFLSLGEMFLALRRHEKTFPVDHDFKIMIKPR